MDNNRRTAAFHNLGCKVNAYETEAMQQLLEEAGYEIVPFEGPADVYVINTCSVTNIADRKSRQMMRRPRKYNPDAVVVAAGCYVQTALEKTGKEIDADIILGNNRKAELPTLLQMFLGQRGGAIGETCILALLLGFGYLLIRKVISWQTPVIFIEIGRAHV